MKKLLSLLLTLAMLSTMFIVGATTVSAAAATTPVEGTYTPTFITVSQETSTTPNTQTITSGRTTKVNASGTVEGTTAMKWHLMKFEIDEFDAVNAVTVKIKNKRTTSAGKIGLYPLTAETWAAAEAAIANGGTPTELLANPLDEYGTSNALDRTGNIGKGSAPSASNPTGTIALTGTAQTNCAIDNELAATTYGGDLVSYLDEAVKAGQTTIYMAIATEAGAGKKVEISSCSLTLTGQRAIEGLGTKIMVEKSDTLYFTGEDEIGYVGKDTTTGEGLEGNQATGAGDYVLITNSSKNLDNRLYLRKDLSAYADKEITKVEFKVYNRQHRSGCKTFIARTDATWIADGENEISYTNQPAVDSTVSEMRFNGSSASNATTTADITSLVENLGTAQNNVLSLRFRSNKYEDKDDKAATFYAVGNGYNSAPSNHGARIVVTYLDELEADGEIPAAKTFKFKAEVATEGTPVMLLVGIYDSTGALIDVVASEVLTAGTDTLVLPVDLSAYSTAASIQGFFWDGTTLNPFMDPTVANVAAAQ